MMLWVKRCLSEITCALVDTCTLLQGVEQQVEDYYSVTCQLFTHQSDFSLTQTLMVF